MREWRHAFYSGCDNEWTFVQEGVLIPDVHMWYSDVYCTGIPVPFREVRRVAFCRRC